MQNQKTYGIYISTGRWEYVKITTVRNEKTLNNRSFFRKVVISDRNYVCLRIGAYSQELECFGFSFDLGCVIHEAIPA